MKGTGGLCGYSIFLQTDINYFQDSVQSNKDVRAKRVRTDRRGSFDRLHRSLEHLLGQPEIGGATVHNALIVVVL